MEKIVNPGAKGVPKTPEEKQKAKENLVERRAIIKNIIETRGWMHMTELLNILTSEYKYSDGSDIDISRQTLYNDLDVIGREIEIYDREKSNLVACYRKKQDEIEALLKKEKDPKLKIQWYKLWNQFAKDYSIVLGRVGAVAAADEKGGGSQKGGVTITFAEGEVKDE